MAEQKVESGRIATGAVTGDKISANSIRGNNIVAGTISGNLIADGTITTIKLQDPAGGFEDLFLMGGL